MVQLNKQAQEVVRLAKEAAREYGLGYVGTEHLLLGIVREGVALGAQVLREQGADEYKVKAEVDRLVQSRMQETWVMGRLPGTPHFKDVIACAATQARGYGNWQVSSEHLLMAILAEQKCMGRQVLKNLGVSPDDVRKAMAAQRVTA